MSSRFTVDIENTLHFAFLSYVGILRFLQHFVLYEAFCDTLGLEICFFQI